MAVDEPLVLTFNKPVYSGRHYPRPFGLGGDLVGGQVRLSVEAAPGVPIRHVKSDDPNHRRIGDLGSQTVWYWPAEDGDLTGDTTYLVTIQSGAFVDAEGQPFAGLSVADAPRFTTAPTPDPSAIVDMADDCGAGFPTVRASVADDVITLSLHASASTAAATPSSLGLTDLWVRVRPPEADRWTRAPRMAWYHEIDRQSLTLDRTSWTYTLPMSETVYRQALDVEVEAVPAAGGSCAVEILGAVERSDARYPTGLPFRYDTSIASAPDRYADLAAEPLPAPDAQALFMATTWWEHYGPEQPDGRDGYYGDVPVGRPMLHGTPLKVAIYGTPSEIDVQSFADTFEVLDVIAPHLDAGFAATPEEVTLAVHYVADCADDAKLGTELFADKRCGGLGYASWDGPGNLHFGHSYGSIQFAERTPDKSAMRIRNGVFHELGHSLGLNHYRCWRSVMRAPNGSREVFGWQPIDLLTIAAIQNPEMPQSLFDNNDYDTVTDGWKANGAYGQGQVSFGPTREEVAATFDVPTDAVWDAMEADRQSMCEVDLSGTFWERLSDSLWAKYSDDPVYAQHAEKRASWSTTHPCYEHEVEQGQDPRGCVDDR